MNSVLACYLLLAAGLAASGEPATNGLIVFEAGRSGPSGLADIANTDNIHWVEKGNDSVLDVETGTDPYARQEALFRFRKAFLAGWDSLVLEVEYFDEGAGVIQPVLLASDAFQGEWAQPLRAVSYTRLNTMQVRRALFEFTVPKLDWEKTANAHLKFAGLQHLKTIRAFRAVPEGRWKTLADSVPLHVTPLVRLERPMAITCTVGIPDTGNPPSLEKALDNIREYAPLAKLLGFTSVECFVRWDLIEPKPGQFDFSHYDRIVAAIRQRDLKWYPNLVITSAFALPAWYSDSADCAGFRCLEHGQENRVPSIWNAANRPHVARVLKAFGEHYVPMNVLEAVRLGPSGNFGEAQYPAGAGSALGYRGEKMHAHIGWWAGDDYARQDFQRFLRERYTRIEDLNAAWDEKHASFEEITPRLPETYRTGRARLDMTAWYTGSMTAWCDFWAGEARAAMPDVPVYQSSGGWGFQEAGTDYSAQAESMKRHGGGIRLTNETDSFEQNVYATRLAATAARLYGIPLGYEPAGYHSARGVAGRFFSTVTTNGSNLYTRHSVLFTDPYSIDIWLRDYPLLDRRADPVIDVALYYPQTASQLDDAAFRHLYAWGFNPRAAEIRRRVDVDYLDDLLIQQGFLDRYRVLVFCWGNVVEADVQRQIDAWIRAGGTVIYPSYPRGPQQTVEGDASRFRAWEQGDTGKGAFHRFQGDMEPLTLYGDYVEGILREVPGLRPETRRMLDVRHPPRVFLSALENGNLCVLNYGETPATVELDGQFTESLGPFSSRIVSWDGGGAEHR